MPITHLVLSVRGNKASLALGKRDPEPFLFYRGSFLLVRSFLSIHLDGSVERICLLGSAMAEGSGWADESPEKTLPFQKTPNQ